MTRHELDPQLGAALGALSAIGLSIALVPLREDLAASTMALLLVLPVLLGAVIGGRSGGVLTAIVAAVSFDFFLTRPYLSLTIESGDDIETAVVLLIVALTIGTVASGANRKGGAAAESQAEIEAIHRVAEAAARGASAPDIIELARHELIGVLDLESCEYEPSDGPSSVPILDHTGATSSTHYRYLQRGLALPNPSRLEVLFGESSLGSFVLHPKTESGAPRDARLTAIVITDQVADVLARARPTGAGTPTDVRG